jgi:formylglycine-generating enzyme required for sulfatase activity/serine/threonine protein kinase
LLRRSVVPFRRSAVPLFRRSATLGLVAALVALSAGSVFAGDFRVVRKLAAGGMGAVYVAEQLSTGRQRALKLMHPGLVENPMLRTKFEQEARIGARIASDHVVEVVAAGVDAATGSPWLAMELLEGEDLATAVRSRGCFAPGEVVAIYEQLCHAVGAAHAAGIVHRDLKPENVYLASSRRAGAAATVKVLDFGIARVVEEARPTSSTGAMGSPYWMSPEQTEQRAAIGPPADVWALGLIAFQLLTGKSFWKTANDPDGSIPMFLREMVLDEIPPASVRAKELGAELPPELDAWFAKCVVRDPAQRFPNANATYEALTAVLGPAARGIVTGPAPSSMPSSRSAPVQITPVSGGGDPNLAHARTVMGEDLEEDAPLPVSRGPSPAIVGVVVVVLLGVAGVVTWAVARTGGSDATSSQKPIDTVTVVLPKCEAGMVAVPSGTFTMGNDEGAAEERPAHQVSVNGFCMDETEVTVSRYGECVAAGTCAPLVATVEWAGVKPDEHGFWDGYCNGGKADRSSHPANCTTFDQASTFCRFAKGRLPSEEEWEWAARGSDGRTYPWGQEAPGAALANVCASECALRANVLGQKSLQAMHQGNDGWEGTAPVKGFPDGKGPFGAFDLSGNVSEWTQGRYCPYPGSNCSNEVRTTRGGSWADGDKGDVRASARHKDAPTARSPLIGFRCVH